MTKFRDSINILLIPTDICNMSCIYCFHEPFHTSHEKMSLALLDKIYNATFCEYKHVSIIWHGGEPLTMGLEFFKHAISMQKKYNNVNIKNTIQSNLTLLTEEYANFFYENKIGIGTSFDGVCNNITRGYSDIIQKTEHCFLIKVYHVAALWLYLIKILIF